MVRVKACGFTLEDCITLDEAQTLTQEGTLASRLLPVDRLFYHLPRISLNEIQSVKFKNGVRLDLNRVKHKRIETMHRVYSADKTFLGLASLDHSDESCVLRKCLSKSEVRTVLECYRDIPQQNDPPPLRSAFSTAYIRAHAQVIRAVIGKEEYVPTVLTFSADTVLPVSKAGSGLLMTEEQKRRRIASLGIQKMFEPSFSEIGGLSAEAFFEEILYKRLRARVLSCGYDYHFGKGARGNADLLQKLCSERKIHLIIVPRCSDRGITVSSSEIRRAISAGDIMRANELLAIAMR